MVCTLPLRQLSMDILGTFDQTLCGITTRSSSVQQGYSCVPLPINTTNIPMDRYLVFGNPVAHSLSPAIHAFFARQTNQTLTYGTSLVPLDYFKECVETFFAQGGKGANVTVPFKQQAFALCKHLSTRAETAQAVNTLYVDGRGVLCGDNTDGIGFMHDMNRLAVPLAGARVLLLGAGGAAFGIVSDLLAAHIQELVVVNRTQSKADALVAHFSHLGTVLATKQEDTLGAFDFVVNATSLSLTKKAPALPADALGKETICYDLAYGKANQTHFTNWASAQGCCAYAGLGMLVGQAAESFRIWRDVMPDVQACLHYLIAENIC